jgi:ABC-type bacteriocin/lantibiotic exporter with double-glycine peptidase domain
MNLKLTLFLLGILLLNAVIFLIAFIRYARKSEKKMLDSIEESLNDKE